MIDSAVAIVGNRRSWLAERIVLCELVLVNRGRTLVENPATRVRNGCGWLKAFHRQTNRSSLLWALQLMIGRCTTSSTTETLYQPGYRLGLFVRLRNVACGACVAACTPSCSTAQTALIEKLLVSSTIRVGPNCIRRRRVPSFGMISRTRSNCDDCAFSAIRGTGAAILSGVPLQRCYTVFHYSE